MVILRLDLGVKAFINIFFSSLERIFMKATKEEWREMHFKNIIKLKCRLEPEMASCQPKAFSKNQKNQNPTS